MTTTAIAAPLGYAGQAARCCARIGALQTIVQHHATHGHVVDLNVLYARLGDVIAATLREEFTMPENPRPKPLDTDEVRRHAQRVVAACRVPIEAPELTRDLRASVGTLLTKASAATLRAHQFMSRGDRINALRAMNESSQAQTRATALLLGLQFDPSDDDDVLPSEVPA
jgi:hypothetical protein